VKCLNSLYEISRLSILVRMTHIVPVVGHPHFGPDEDDLAIVDDHTAIVRYVLVKYWPDISLVLNRVQDRTYIPISHMIPWASSLCKILARTSQECNTVSPSKKWSRQPYPGISSSGPTRSDAPRSLATAMDFRILSQFPFDCQSDLGYINEDLR